MRSQTLGLLCVALISLAIGTAHAQSEINFDDITFPGGNPTALAYLSAGYHGFDWGGDWGTDTWVVSPNDATGWYGGTLQPYSHSGNNFAWNNGGKNLQLSVHDGGTFDLQSFWVRSWPAISVDVTAHGYLGGTEIYTLPFTTSDIYSQVTANFSNIDVFTLTLQAPRSLLFDDFRVNNVVPVPEPGSIALLVATGLSVTGFLARRRTTTRPSA